ncbi:MAG TPA: cupin domain-containing protein [Chryseolinea sp.]
MTFLKAEETNPTIVKPGIKRRLLHTENLMVVAIEFEGGPWDKPDPLHNHVHEQITYIAEGEVIFFSEGEPDQVLKAGDMVSIPSLQKHAIQLLSGRAVLIDSFNPPREDFL